MTLLLPPIFLFLFAPRFQYCFWKKFQPFIPCGVTFSPRLITLMIKIVKKKLDCWYWGLKKRLDALITLQKSRTHFDIPFWRKKALTIKEVQLNWNFFIIFSRFFPKWYIKQGQFILFWTQWIKTLNIGIQIPYESEHLPTIINRPGVAEAVL